MKHLEELEKELEELLEKAFLKLLGPKTSITKKYIINDLLLSRQILQANDAVEKRKGQLRFLLIPNRGMMTLEQLANLIGTKLSDYEWEWLKQQGKENKDA